MADSCNNITPQEESLLISKLLPALPGIEKLVEILYFKSEEIKVKYINELSKLIDQFKGLCPPQPTLTKIINKRNNLVEALNKVYSFIDKISNTLSGVNTFLLVIATIIQVAGVVLNVALLIMLFAPFIPGTVAAKLAAGNSTVQEVIKKIQFTSKGEQRLVPLIAQVNSAAIAIQLLANVLNNFICKLEGLDNSIKSCSKPEIVNVPLKKLSPELLNFVTQVRKTTENSDIEADYRGFSFKIEEVPFSSTVNRKRALALNSDGITLLQSELSFTSTPNILIQELKLIIDRDNLKAN